MVKETNLQRHYIRNVSAGLCGSLFSLSHLHKNVFSKRRERKGATVERETLQQQQKQVTLENGQEGGAGGYYTPEICI